MKIAFYVEDGLEQVVFTPETETERGILGKLHDGSRVVEIKQGSFYECRGGWVRFRPAASWDGLNTRSRDDESTMLVLRAAEKKEGAE